MGLFDFIKSQLIEVIEWTDDTTDTLIYRFPVEDNEIKMGAQLTVRESQTAVFVNEGRIADMFTPGRYELTTANMPVLTKLKSWEYGFNSPFKAEVYFVNTKQFTNQKWGTANPIMMRDQEFGMLRLRAFGLYSFRVIDSVTFIREIFGTNSIYQAQDIAGQLKGLITSGLADLIAELKMPALDLAGQYDELGQQAKIKLTPRFNALGLEMTSLVIENISLPEEVEGVLDKRTSMGIIGDMGKYTQYQTAEALREAASNESGAAGLGVGLGAGIGLGQMVAQAMQNAQPMTTARAETVSCPKCNVQNDAGSNFCCKCGSSMLSTQKCDKCGHESKGDLNFCPQCGAKLE